MRRAQDFFAPRRASAQSVQGLHGCVDALGPTKATDTSLEHLRLPRTVLESDFMASMPKIKSHRWASVMLSCIGRVSAGIAFDWPIN